MTTIELAPETQNFTFFNLSEPLMKSIEDMGFQSPSSIQKEAIPQIMMGNDIIAKAPTGSGKTAAFAIPILEKLDLNESNKNIQSLVLCPTRELAIQVHREFEKLCKYQENVSVVSLYGGQQIDKQLNALNRKPQVIVATPGRLMDHLRRGSVKLDYVSIVVLDEADEMLDMGFREDINTILEDTPENRQTILFSATMAKDIIELTKRFQKYPNIVDVTDNLQNTPNIDQCYLEVVEKDKSELLTRLLDLHKVKLGLVFCNTKSSVDKVVENLKSRGYFADSLHGDMNQTQREKVMRGFRNGSVEILVATDVAGRGIDVKNVEAVFNYDLPRDDEDYIHRIGRTGRAGNSGFAFSFVSKRQVQSLIRIERANGVKINKREVPSYEELEAARLDSYSTKMQNIIKCDDLSEFEVKIQSMVSEETSLLTLAAALLKLSLNKESKKINKHIVFEEDSNEDDRRSSGRRSRGGRDRRGFEGRRREKSSPYGFSSSNKNRQRENKPKKAEKLSLEDMIGSVRSLNEPQKKKKDFQGRDFDGSKKFFKAKSKKKNVGGTKKFKGLNKK